MKYFKFILFSILLFLFTPMLKVNASNLDSLSFLNRTQGNFPFVTNYATSYTDHYTAQYYLFSGTDNLPNYAIVTTCATGPLSFTNLEPQSGSNLTYMGYVNLGGSCKVNSTYDGQVYVYYFNLISYTDAGNGNMGINYSVDVKSATSYNVFVNFTSISFSNSSDFSTILQNQTLIQSQKDLNDKQQQTNDKLNDLNDKQQDTNDLITDGTSPDLDFDSMAGWLPAGPVDSIINLPLTFFTNLSSNLGKSCAPVNIPLPFVDKNYQLPCIKSLFAKIDGFSTVWNLYVGTFASCLILFSYLLKLYKWVDDTLTYRENNSFGDWGGV